MEYMICVVPVMPLRAAPSHQSEMVSQLVFGECAVILETASDGWVRLHNQYDRYEGWATQNQLTGIEEELYLEPTEEYTSDWVTEVSVSGHAMHVPLGSFLKGLRHGTMLWGRIKVVFKGVPLAPQYNKELACKEIKRIAFQFLNTPYLWGGRSVYGIDCSGFTQSVYRLAGKLLPRDASEQAKCGQALEAGVKPGCGDLAFFANENGKITHVGILLNDFEIIHSAGKVRVDQLDDKGIVNTDTGLYSHQLAMIKRMY